MSNTDSKNDSESADKRNSNKLKKNLDQGNRVEDTNFYAQDKDGNYYKTWDNTGIIGVWWLNTLLGQVYEKTRVYLSCSILDSRATAEYLISNIKLSIPDVVIGHIGTIRKLRKILYLSTK